MPAVFLVSDTHFGHAGVCRFLRDDGTKLHFRGAILAGNAKKVL